MSTEESLPTNGKLGRAEAIQAATDLINENLLLQRDPVTREMLDEGFVHNSEELDPGEWIHERLEVLKEEEKSGAAKSGRHYNLEQDLKKRQGD